MSVLSDMLDDNKPSSEFKDDVAANLSNPIRSSLSKLDFGSSIMFRYGGSLKKGTANKNSCDLDLLCYVDSQCATSVKDIYNQMLEVLQKDQFYVYPKNSALKVTGKAGDKTWETTVDVVPGKYIDNDEGDVLLWCNKDSKTLKTNPDKQIDKVRHSQSRDVIRLIKLFRDNNNFSFKSFFLEIFAIDVVEPTNKKDDDLMGRLVNFCRHYNEIGKTTIHDPANQNNDIMNMYTNDEFVYIQNMIKKLLKALLTDDDEAISECFYGEDFSEDEAYKRDALKHCSDLSFTNNYSSNVNIFANQSKDKSMCSATNLFSNNILSKDVYLKFFVTSFSTINRVEWLICNAGYEARIDGQLRGSPFIYSNTKDDAENKDGKERYEHTRYYGNHFVQGKVYFADGHTSKTPVFVVKIRTSI